MRLPRPRTRCPVTNLSRTTIEELIKSGAIKAKRLRRPGRTRAITLIPMEALVAWANALPEALNEAEATSAGSESSADLRKQPSEMIGRGAACLSVEVAK
jgi:cobalamin biosynthesis Mg chelatase CobN